MREIDPGRRGTQGEQRDFLTQTAPEHIRMASAQLCALRNESLAQFTRPVHRGFSNTSSRWRRRAEIMSIAITAAMIINSMALTSE
jgi:hypothetical protein